MKVEKMWAVVGIHGLYEGMWFTRRDAIRGHVVWMYGEGADREERIKVWWKIRRAKGDRAIKAEVSYELPQEKPE